MKIALVQLDASNDDAWSVDRMESLLRLSAGVDLVVFPEGILFDQTGKYAIFDNVAIEKLYSVISIGKPFIAVGYVRYGGHLRNVAYLIHNGAMIVSYFKRVKWRGEHFEPGNESVKFSWGTKACIPLICADAGDNPSPTGTRTMHQALELGANANTPIVIPSFGAGLMTSYWKVPLTTWARGCGAPVAICGVWGKVRIPTTKMARANNMVAEKVPFFGQTGLSQNKVRNAVFTLWI